MSRRKPCKREGCPGFTPFGDGAGKHEYCSYVCQHIDRELTKVISGAASAVGTRGYEHEYYREAHLLLLDIAAAQDAYNQHVENRIHYYISRTV